MSASSKIAIMMALCAATPAAAQYYQPPPPPPGPPPGYYPPPPPPPSGSYGQRPTQQPPSQNNTLRVSGGMALTTTGYFCGYPGYSYYCGAAYSAVLANVNLDLDLAVSRSSALTVGTNVMWGGYNGISSTTWEPHLDYLLRGSPLAPARWRFRIGGGIYIASANGSSYGGPNATTTGGALRIGGGLSLLTDSPVGIGLDAIFESGSLNGYYVSTLQLLAGPEFRF